MSRLGNKPMPIPQGVSITFDDNQVKIKGPKGELVQDIGGDIKLEVKDTEVVLTRPTDQKRHKAMHGLYRALVGNMITGVSEGYKISLELVGVGYKAVAQGNTLELSLGYSHAIFFQVPDEIKVTAEMVKGKNPLVHLEGSDKQLIGQVAAKLRELRKIEPYKGKGIRFVGEQIRRKAGKTAAK
jgi:large subunit ribosomal protein L6